MARPVLVSCDDCSREWHTATMAEGLRLIGTCPRCGGHLRFADDAPAPAAEEPAADAAIAPHLVLGVPRR